ncbi:hypothetical protein T492DRAFT_1066357 [Pavlovales sp. CCMP2436]|nr:hypothetical protein T492DRAFT_1066357 [Pavlovales sp. CCMP2436]
MAGGPTESSFRGGARLNAGPEHEPRARTQSLKPGLQYSRVEQAAATSIQRRARGMGTRAAIVYDVRAEYQAIFAELEKRAPDATWLSAGKLCTPRQQPRAAPPAPRVSNGERNSLTPALQLSSGDPGGNTSGGLHSYSHADVDSSGELHTLGDGDGDAAGRMPRALEQPSREGLEYQDADEERLQVERELAWIRQAIHSRVEYLEEAQIAQSHSDVEDDY